MCPNIVVVVAANRNSSLRHKQKCKGKTTTTNKQKHNTKHSKYLLYVNTNISILLKCFIQVCGGVETSLESSQYVDLGQLPEACIANPSSCGDNGGSVSLWVKLLNCSTGGIITSDIQQKDGFKVYCERDQIK